MALSMGKTACAGIRAFGRGGDLRPSVMLSLALCVPTLAQPALRRDPSNQRDWTLHVEVRLKTAQVRANDPRYVPVTPDFVLSSLEFVYPVLPSSAIHDGYVEKARGRFQIDTVPVDESPDILTGYQSLSSIAVWTARDIRSPYLVFVGEFDMTCYETRIDERAARARDWPAPPWSKELALCLEPQLFVEVGDPAVQGLVRQWTRGDPRAMKPYDLAKTLAGRVIEHMRITEPPTLSKARGPVAGGPSSVLLSGFNVNGAAFASREKKGSPFDMPCLLTAVYRAAGLPARLVIGFDIEESEKRQGTVLRSWVEFFLPGGRGLQPVQGAPSPAVTSADGEWIPVDIYRQWEFSSRAPPMNHRWQHFGHNEESDFLVPIAFHWLPPADCTNSGPPGIWGWRPAPVVPAADAELKFWAYETPKRGGEKKRR